MATVTPVLVAELLAEGERMPVCARTKDDYTIREWVEAADADYVPVDGELELLPGVRLVPTPGHTPGSQVVVVQTGGRSVVIAGDTAVSSAELDEPRTEGQREVRLAHEHEPGRPTRAFTG